VTTRAIAAALDRAESSWCRAESWVTPRPTAKATLAAAAAMARR